MALARRFVDSLRQAGVSWATTTPDPALPGERARQPRQHEVGVIRPGASHIDRRRKLKPLDNLHRPHAFGRPATQLTTCSTPG
jgi:hypothetical protein